MKRIAALAAAYDRREPIPVLVQRNVVVVREAWGRKSDAFWEQLRADYCWLSVHQLAERHGVTTSTIKKWLQRAWEGVS